MSKSKEILGNKKIITAWTFFHWANSAYSLVICVAIYPIYFTNVLSIDDKHNTLFLGHLVNADSLQTWAVSISFLVIAALNPLLSSIADYAGNKKRFMYFFSTLGSFSCCTLYFFKGPETIAIGLFGAIFAAIGFAGSVVFYYSFLPEIAPPEDQDKVSARAFAMGYIGSSILLIFNLFMIQFPEYFFDVTGKMNSLMAANPALLPADALQMGRDFYAGPSTRFSFLLVGFWWFAFAQYTFAYLPNNIYNKKPAGGRYLFNGYKELKKVFAQVKNTKRLKKFLISFFFYNMGCQTVLYVATLFGNSELHLPKTVLIAIILLLQFVAAGGAFIFSFLSKKLGNFPTLTIAIIIWMLIAIGAYFDNKAYGVNEQTVFIIIGGFVGLVMGGIQAISLSTYSKLLPETMDHASFFSFYDVCDKTGIVIGTFAFGLINAVTGEMRNSLIVLLVFFIVGLVMLLRVPSEKKALLGDIALEKE